MTVNEFMFGMIYAICAHLIIEKGVRALGFMFAGMLALPQIVILLLPRTPTNIRFTMEIVSICLSGIRVGFALGVLFSVL